jgi:hypothetical protein
MRNQRTSEQSSAFEGDIEGVTAGNGLSGGGTSGTVALALDLSELSTATVATGDYVAVEDVTDNSSKKVTAQSIADLAPQGDITGVTAGTLVDVTDPTGPAPTVNVDLSEAATSTSDADGDYFLVTDAAAAQYKLTKANIALSGMNNDSGWTSNAGDITGITTAATSGLNGGATSGAATLVVDASRLTALGAEAAATDYVVLYDTDASATKKVLVSNIPITWG